MKTIHKYTLPEDVAKNVRMVAKFDLYMKDHPDYPSHSVIWKEEVRRRIADTVLRIIVEQEKKKLLK
jgi:hypothetical protein